MEEYLKTLDMSELITYLEIEKQPDTFKKVEKILVSREKKMANLKESMEVYQGKCAELSKAVEEEKKKYVGVEGRCSELMAALEVERKKNVEFERLKTVSIKLGEKVKRLEEECRVAGEREKSAVHDAATLLDEFDKTNKKRIKEFEELKARNQVLERGIQNAMDDFGELKAKNEVLERGMRKAGDEVEAQKRRCVELEKMVEHVNELQRDLMIHQRYKGLCEELQQKVMRLENERNIISGKEKSARQKVISLLGGVEKEKNEKEKIAKLMDDLEKVSKKRDAELLELKGKNQILEDAKQKAEDEMAAQKKVRIELEKAMEKTIRRLNELEEDLEMHKRYKTACNELEEKVTRLDRDCKNIGEKEKNAKERIANLSGDLEKEKTSNERITYLLGDLEKLNTQVMTMNRSLELAKRKADGEVEIQKKRYEDLEKTVQQTAKHTNDLEKELEIYKAKCSEFSEKASKKRDEDIVKLKTKIKDLESAKQKSDDEIESQKEQYKELEKTVKNISDLEKDLEVYKAKCSELFVALEERKLSMNEEAMLKKFTKYKTFCDEFREKVAHLDDYKVVPEKRKRAKKRTIPANLEAMNGDGNAEVTKPKDRKKKHKRLENEGSQLNDEALALVCEPQIPAIANIELIDEVSKEVGIDQSKQGKVQSENNGGMNGTTCAAKLKIRLKPLNCICEGRVCDSSGACSICHSAVKSSGSGHTEVPTVKRKQKRKSLNSDGGVDGDHIRRDKLKKGASGSQVPAVSHNGDQSLDPSIHHTNSPRKEKKGGAEKISLKISEPSSHTNSSRKHEKKDVEAEKIPLKTSEPSNDRTDSPREHQKKDVGVEKTLLKTSEPSSHHTTSPRKNEKKDAGAEKTPFKTPESVEITVEKSANSIPENDKEKPKTTEGKSRRNVHPPNRLNL